MLNKSNEIECNAVNNLNIKLDSEYLNKDSLYKLAQHTEKMDTSIESLGSNRRLYLSIIIKLISSHLILLL